MAKFYEFKNKANNEVDLLIYGDIIGGGSKYDSTDVTITDFKNQLDNLGSAKTLNMYINSCGGDVLTTQAMIAMLQRVKDNGTTINAYIDGLGASCASFLPMVANNIYAYNSSLLMVHHPMTMAWGNVNDFQAQMDVLNKIEDSVMMPLYMSKVKEGIEEDYIKALIDKETWLDAEEMSSIFNISILEDSKQLVACVEDKNILNSFKNIPLNVKDLFEEKPIEEPKNNIEKEKLLIEIDLI